MNRNIGRRPNGMVSNPQEVLLQRTQIGQQGLWTVRELAAFLGMSERWVHERTRRDEIPCHRLGTALRFDPEEVQVWLINRRESAGSHRGAA